jgi:hypothetical protein
LRQLGPGRLEDAAAAEQAAQAAQRINALNQQLRFQTQALQQVRAQLDNGRAYAAWLLDNGYSINPYGLGREIYETFPAEIAAMESRIQEIADELRSLGEL